MRRLSLLCLIPLLALIACQQQAEPPATEQAPPAAAEPPVTAPEGQGQIATAELQFAPGTEGHAKATFTPEPTGVRIALEVHGLTAGEHGVHLHQVGECTPPDFTSAGDHFNPTAAPHGGPNSEMHHAGDFGNIVVGEDGSGTLELVAQGITMEDVVGKAVVVHAQPDDFTTQPTGGSGARIACGVVRMAPGEPAQM